MLWKATCSSILWSTCSHQCQSNIYKLESANFQFVSFSFGKETLLRRARSVNKANGLLLRSVPGGSRYGQHPAHFVSVICDDTRDST